MAISAKDRQFMRITLELADQAAGLTSPNPMVGAVIVSADGQIVGQGWHRKAGMPHAEVEALQEAGQSAQGGTLYVNLEPCCHHGRTPPCTDAIIKAGLSRVVAGMIDPNPAIAGSGLKRLRVQGIEVECGVLESEARFLNQAFITWNLLNRPFIIAKWAMTLDGRTASDSGDSKWISNDISRKYVHRIRSSVDAIAVGFGTVFFDDPRLDVRLDDYEGKQPTRIIFDGGLRTPIEARALKSSDRKTIIICTQFASKDRMKRLEDDGHQVLIVPGKKRVVDVTLAMTMLAEQGILSLLVEGGRQLHTSLLNARLVDKVIAFISPTLVGTETGSPPIVGLGAFNMRQALHLKNVKTHMHGTDACIEGYLNLPPKK